MVFVICLQQLVQQLRSTESLAETLEHENEQVGASSLLRNIWWNVTRTLRGGQLSSSRVRELDC
jgi:hypothetical protein